MAKLVIGTNKTVGVPAVVKVVEVTPVEPYPLLSRVKDDSNNEIGTVCGYHTDANNQKYAVVCLDAQYRLASGNILSENNVNIPNINAYPSDDVYESKDTATSNCTKILDFADANNYTSSAISHCRSKSFVIDGITYYGQVPNLPELLDIYKNKTTINTKDTSASQYSSLIVPTGARVWSSTPYGASSSWWLKNTPDIYWLNRTNSNMVIPVLEIPINE